MHRRQVVEFSGFGLMAKDLQERVFLLLKLARLPVPPSGHSTGKIGKSYFGARRGVCQRKRRNCQAGEADVVVYWLRRRQRAPAPAGPGMGCQWPMERGPLVIAEAVSPEGEAFS